MKLDRIEVPMGKGYAGRENDLLYTRNLGTCLGLALHDNNFKKGLVYHFPGSEIDSLQLLERVLDEVSNDDEFSNNLAGRVISPMMTRDREAVALIEEARKFIPGILDRYSHNMDITTHFCEPEYGVALLGIAPGKGRFFQKEFTDPMFLDMWGE